MLDVAGRIFSCLYYEVEEIAQLVSNKSEEATICKNVKRICKYNPGLSRLSVSKSSMSSFFFGAEGKMSLFSTYLADSLHFLGILGTFSFSFPLLALSLCADQTLQFPPLFFF